jgi:hypothetical protein
MGGLVLSNRLAPRDHIPDRRYHQDRQPAAAAGNPRNHVGHYRKRPRTRGNPLNFCGGSALITFRATGPAC